MIDKRIFEIDFLKVTALIMMIVFHIVYDLNEFVGINIDYRVGFWYWIGKIAALLFIFLAGINSCFSSRPIKRGITVFLCGIGITIVTFIFLRGEYVRFGILHFLGVCILISPYLKKLNNWILLLIAVSIIMLVNFDVLSNTNLIILLRNIFGGRPSIDYYPLFPYLSVFIFGIIAYKIFYCRKESIINWYSRSKILYMISKYSLSIYLIHQPIILGMIYLLNLY